MHKTRRQHHLAGRVPRASVRTNNLFRPHIPILVFGVPVLYWMGCIADEWGCSRSSATLSVQWSAVLLHCSSSILIASSSTNSNIEQRMGGPDGWDRCCAARLTCSAHSSTHTPLTRTHSPLPDRTLTRTHSPTPRSLTRSLARSLTHSIDSIAQHASFASPSTLQVHDTAAIWSPDRLFLGLSQVVVVPVSRIRCRIILVTTNCQSIHPLMRWQSRTGA